MNNPKNLFAQLPEVLHFEILQYLEVSDRIEFARSSKALCSHLIKQAREIEVVQVKKFFEAKSFRNILLSLISDPLRQLKIFIPEGMTNNDSLNVTRMAQFSSSFTKFEMNFQHDLIQVNHLALGHSGCENLDSLEFYKVFHDGILNDLGVKYLEISWMNIADFPVTPELEELELLEVEELTATALHISELRNLWRLQLDSCPDITDVSCLDYIYDLTLQACDGITDISCLHHNHRIVVRHCENIEDFSKSFRFSKVIELVGCGGQLSSAESVRQLTLSDEGSYSINNGVLMLPPSPFLRVLDVSSISEAFTLPENHLREVSITCCPGFHSCLNVGNIYKVCLEKLPSLSLLEGMGQGNKIVEIYNCPQIADLTPLQDCDRITVLHGPEWFNSQVLSKVKEIHFSLSETGCFNKIPIDHLVNVTHLDFYSPLERQLMDEMISEVPLKHECEFNKILLNNLSKTLKMLSLYCGDSNIEEILQMLCDSFLFHKIEKILLYKRWFISGAQTPTQNMTNTEPLLLHIFKSSDSPLFQRLCSLFIVEAPFRSNKFILLRKEQ